MAAILTGDESLVGDVIRSMNLMGLQTHITLFDELGRFPLAVVAQSEPGSHFLSFVTRKGSLVGRRINFCS
jgi:hypothetical protein